MMLIEQLGDTVDVVLETSHGNQSQGHTDLYREHIEMPILQSTLWDFEELLVNDGCTGIAVLNPRLPQEVQLDEHKLLIIYGKPLEPYERILESFGVRCREEIKFLTERFIRDRTSHLKPTGIRTVVTVQERTGS